MVQNVGRRGVDTLLALHGGLHHGMVRHQGIGIVLVVFKDLLLDALAEAVLRHERDDLGGMLLLGVDPADHLVDVLSSSRGVELRALDHGLADGGGGLLDFFNNGWIVEYPAGNLTMSASEAQDEVKGRLLLDVVIRQGAAVLELLAGEDETLLVGGDALLVLDLGLDVVNGVGGLDVESDGLAG